MKDVCIYLYYIMRIASAGAIALWALYLTVRALINGANFIITLCFAAMAVVAFALLCIPRINDYKKFKEHKRNHVPNHGE